MSRKEQIKMNAACICKDIELHRWKAIVFHFKGLMRGIFNIKAN